MRAASLEQLLDAMRILPSYMMPKGLLPLVSSLCLATLCGGWPLLAQTDPASLPARESHQGLTVAVKPMLAEAAYKTQFGSRTPYEGGIAALEVFFRNDNDTPIRVNLGTMRLLVSRPGESLQRLQPLSAEEVANKVLLQEPVDPRRPRIPIPLGGRGANSGRDKNWQEFSARLQAAGVNSDIVGPNSTVKGFLFFDVNHHYDWLSRARLDVPDLAFMLNNEALFFFQVDLAPALR
jgi:hypothetical protein